MNVVTRNTNKTTNSAGEAVCSPQVKSQSLLVQIVALAGAGGLAYWEFFSNNSTSWLMLESRNSSYLLGMGVVNIGILLGSALLAMFLVAQGKVINEQTPAFDDILSQLLSAESRSTISDLLVKYCFIVLIIAGGESQRLAAVLILFIADYLFKGSYFSIPKEVAIPLGVACFAAAVTLVFYQGSSLLWAYAAFLVVGTISASYRYAVETSQLEHYQLDPGVEMT